MDHEVYMYVVYIWKWSSAHALGGVSGVTSFYFYWWKASIKPRLLFSRAGYAISPDKARKGVIYPLKTGIYALVGISKRTFTR